MADRQWFAEGIQVFETGEEEYFAEGVQLTENQPDVIPPSGGIASDRLLIGVGRSTRD